MPEAINEAVEECIEKGILKEFLQRHQKEVKNMCLTEFDEKKYAEIMREEGREEEKILSVKKIISSLGLTLEEACHALGVTVKEYEEAQKLRRLD